MAKPSYILAAPRAFYRIQKGEQGTISNGKMTDALAEQFLAIDPKRIKLFKTYPDDWKERIDVDVTTTQVDIDDAIDASLKTDENPTIPTAEELDQLPLFNLKESYPEVEYKSDMKKDDFINAIIDSLK